MEGESPAAGSQVATTVWRVDECVVWRTKHPVANARSEPGGALSGGSPVLGAGLAISILSGPNVIWAASKESGHVVWVRQVDHAVGMHCAGERLYLQVSDGVVCLESATGMLVWEATSGAAPLERVSARPTVVEGRVLWPTMGGQVACADASSGRLLWVVRRPRSTISPLVPVAGTVVGVEGKATTYGLDLSDGRQVWARSLPGDTVWPSASQGMHGVLVRLEAGLILLDPANGTEMARWRWPGRVTGAVTAGPDIGFAVCAERFDMVSAHGRLIMGGEGDIVRLAGSGRIEWRRETVPFAGACLWDDRGGVLYEMRGSGIGVIDSASGERTHLLPIAGASLLTVPAVDGDRLFVSATDGEMLCIRSPTGSAKPAALGY